MTERGQEAPQEPNILEFRRSLNVGEVHIPVPGLIPETVVDDRSGEEKKTGNFQDPRIQSAIGEILSKPRYEALVNGIKSGTKMAFSTFSFAKNENGERQMGLKITVITIGTLTAAAAYEFGIRHGQDVREVLNIFKPKDEPKP